MIELYTWKTPNGRKIPIMLEETGLPYRVHPVDIGAREQHWPSFLRINPNAKIPAIVDQEGPSGRPFTIFESGAILVYLAEKTGRFMPAEARARNAVIQWLMFQIGGVGPLFGQCYHFRSAAPERIPYAIERYTNEVARLYGVLERRLGESEYVGGDYSIADMAIWPWVRNPAAYAQAPEDLPNLARWSALVAARPAVKRALKVVDKALEANQPEAAIGARP